METLVVGLGAPAFVLAAAWAGWVSKKLMEIMVLLKGLEVKVQKHEDRLNDLEDLLPRHIPAP